MLILIRGLPGSGKTVRAKEFPYFHIEIDMFRYKNGRYIYRLEEDKIIASRCYEVVRSLLSCKADVIVANTFTRRAYIEPYRRLAEECGVDFIVETMTGQYRSTHGVPTEVIERMKDDWEDWPGEVFPLKETPDNQKSVRLRTQEYPLA